MRALMAAIATAGLGAVLTWVEGAAHNGAAWLLAHPQIDVGISLWLLVSIANKLQSNPATATGTIEYVLRKAIDVVSVLPHADAKGVIGGALARYLAPGPAQAALQLLFGWFNLPALGSKPNAPPNDGAVPVPTPPARGFVRAYGLPLTLVLVSGAFACAFWRSIKADEIDCVREAEASVQMQIIPEITLLLATGGANWPQALAVLEKDAGDAVLCAVAAVVNGLEKAGAPPSAAPPSPAAVPARALTLPAADPSLGLFCALAERDGSPLPDPCITLNAASKAAGRARAYLGAAKKKPVLVQ